ncbi:MAG: rRNA pseudouridine synthase, partial [Clostridia bacterium]|nr:rRNA pseudouridine synthase [Clostridia bacterium]
YMTAAGAATRKECAQYVRAGRITVNGLPAQKADMQVDAQNDIRLDGAPVIYREFTYLMMNKPQGVVSATDDPGETTVLDLLPDNLRRLNLFPCGRLDKNTTGFVLLTTDGVLSHRVLAPKRHVEKVYRFSVKFPLSPDDISALEAGVTLAADSYAEEWKTAPCKIRLYEGNKSGEIILVEGKYHEIKRMMEAVHNQVTSLSRIAFAGIALDETLAPGAWRYLTAEEEALLRRAAQ